MEILKWSEFHFTRTFIKTKRSNHVIFCLSAVAMKAMNKVASHINEMQKIHEEFGAVFDQLITEQSGEKKEVSSRPTGVARPSSVKCSYVTVFVAFARLLISPWATCCFTQACPGSTHLPPWENGRKSLSWLHLVCRRASWNPAWLWFKWRVVWTRLLKESVTTGVFFCLLLFF